MIWHGHAVRVFAHAAPTDLRKGYDGLSALVRESLGRDPGMRCQALRKEGSQRDSATHSRRWFEA